MEAPSPSENKPGPSDAHMRRAMLAYLDALNAGDLEAIMALYADDARLEDPVGAPAVRGHAAIRHFYAASLQAGFTVRLVTPVRTSAGASAAMAFEVLLPGAVARAAGLGPGGDMLIRVIDVMTFDSNGKFIGMQAFWGQEDVIPA